ncbi:MAG: hypothetical protein ACREJC_22210 [Tepidisphaeraceae bacterium]
MKRSTNYRSIICRRASLEPLEPRQLLAAGALDKSFSGDGKTTLEFAGGQFVAEDVAVQLDGKTVVVGHLPVGSGFIKHIIVARYNVDGTFDPAFDPVFHRGFTQSHVGDSDDHNFVRAVAIQGDGKIVVAGDIFPQKGSDYDWFVARYLPDGSLDKSFDGDGKRTIDFHGVLRDLLIQRTEFNGQPIERIVLVGQHNAAGFLSFDADFNFAIARLNPNGALDKTFDGDGKTNVGFGTKGDPDTAHAAALGPSGTIVVAGESGSGRPRIAVTRLLDNGARDPAFGQNGTVLTFSPFIRGWVANGVILQGSGKIVVAGSAGDSSEPSNPADFVLVRYLANGAIDTSFGASAGFQLTEFGGNDRAFDLIQSSDGGLVAAGTTNGKFALAGFTANGLIKNSFGTLGKVVPNFGSVGGFDTVGLAKGPGRRFVMAGGSKFSTARFLDTGANVVSVGALRTLATEGASDFGSLLVTRTERLPTATRIFFSITGTASGPGFGVPRPDYDLEGIKLPSPFGGEQRPFVDIPANQTFVTAKLTPRNDTKVEGPETALFSILPSSSYEIGTNPDTRIDIADDDQVHINFQTNIATSAGPEFVKDIGQVFGSRGNGLSYGWDADITGSARVRNNVRSPDFRYDSLIKMQDGGANRTWEIAIPNGLYQVRLVAGDPDFTDSIYKMNLEGLAGVTGTPRDDIRWFRRWVNVQVNDGRLSLTNAVGSSNNKIAFIDIKSAKVGSKAGDVTDDTAVHLLPPPAARSFSLAWRPITHSMFSDERIEELS